MEQNRITYSLIILAFVFLASCSNDLVSKADHRFKEGKNSFLNQFNNRSLFVHFPERVTSDCLGMYSSPPSRRGTKNTGLLYLICPLDKPGNEIEKIIKESTLYYTEYGDSTNIIINLSELKHTVFPVPRSNKWYASKYPIPYFESFDFGLGEKETRKIVDGETYYNYTHTIPPDLKVYVISAEPGNFWKVKCDEKRPASLKEWQNGYSRGIVISEEKDIVVYWTMVW